MCPLEKCQQCHAVGVQGSGGRRDLSGCGADGYDAGAVLGGPGGSGDGNLRLEAAALGALLTSPALTNRTLLSYRVLATCLLAVMRVSTSNKVCVPSLICCKEEFGACNN